MTTRATAERRLLPGALAGLCGSLAGLILVYLTGALAIFLKDRDALATLLAAASFLPLMLILVFFPPNLALGVSIGLLLGAFRRPSSRPLRIAAGASIGLIGGELWLSLILPSVITPQPGDFVSIISNRYLTGAYGAVLGVITSCLFGLFIKRDARPVQQGLRR